AGVGRGRRGAKGGRGGSGREEGGGGHGARVGLVAGSGRRVHRGVAAARAKRADLARARRGGALGWQYVDRRGTSILERVAWAISRGQRTRFDGNRPMKPLPGG